MKSQQNFIALTFDKHAPDINGHFLNKKSDQITRYNESLSTSYFYHILNKQKNDKSLQRVNVNNRVQKVNIKYRSAVKNFNSI